MWLMHLTLLRTATHLPNEAQWRNLLYALPTTNTKPTCAGLYVLETLHPAVRNICHLLWPTVGNRAEDDVACYNVCICWHFCSLIDYQVHFCVHAILYICIFLSPHASIYCLMLCALLWCLPVCLCELVCVSTCALYSLNSWQGWFGSQSVNVTIGLCLPPSPTALCLLAHLSLPQYHSLRYSDIYHQAVASLTPYCNGLTVTSTVRFEVNLLWWFCNSVLFVI